MCNAGILCNAGIMCNVGILCNVEQKQEIIHRPYFLTYPDSNISDISKTALLQVILEKHDSRNKMVVIDSVIDILYTKVR